MSITANNIYVYTTEEKGDFVKCLSCETLQIVSKGEGECGRCGHNVLDWADDVLLDNVTLDDLKNIGYDIVFLNEEDKKKHGI